MGFQTTTKFGVNAVIEEIRNNQFIGESHMPVVVDVEDLRTILSKAPKIQEIQRCKICGDRKEYRITRSNICYWKYAQPAMRGCKQCMGGNSKCLTQIRTEHALEYSTITYPNGQIEATS
jgi:hypothetical protein